MTHTRLTHSDAYYVAQLLEKLENLEKQLTSKLSPGAELTQRTRTLLKDLNQLLAQREELAQDMLEYSFMPKVNRLLLDTRQQLKLKMHLHSAGKSISHAKKREQLIQARLSGPPPQPYPGVYRPTPMPLRDEERCALIEDALDRLKMLLSDS